MSSCQDVFKLFLGTGAYGRVSLGEADVLAGQIIGPRPPPECTGSDVVKEDASTEDVPTAMQRDCWA